MAGPRELDDRLRRQLGQSILEQSRLPAGVVVCGTARLRDQPPELGVIGPDRRRGVCAAIVRTGSRRR
jgi:hypothetical protein